jgi:hypothetical protein
MADSIRFATMAQVENVQHLIGGLTGRHLNPAMGRDSEHMSSITFLGETSPVHLLESEAGYRNTNRHFMVI